jgi:hypothetical protein
MAAYPRSRSWLSAASRIAASKAGSRGRPADGTGDAAACSMRPAELLRTEAREDPARSRRFELADRVDITLW